LGPAILTPLFPPRSSGNPAATTPAAVTPGNVFDPLLDGAVESHNFWSGVVFRPGHPKLAL